MVFPNLGTFFISVPRSKSFPACQYGIPCRISHICLFLSDFQRQGFEFFPIYFPTSCRNRHKTVIQDFYLQDSDLILAIFLLLSPHNLEIFLTPFRPIFFAHLENKRILSLYLESKRSQPYIYGYPENLFSNRKS